MQKKNRTFLLLWISRTMYVSILALKWITKGQNNLFQALKWGIVRLCSLNIFGDTSINVKILFLQFFEFCKIWRIFLSKSGNLEIIVFLCLVISLDKFELERRTIPHFKAGNKTFWPLFLWNYSEGCCYQVISKIKCPISFCTRPYKVFRQNGKTFIKKPFLKY